MRCSVFIALALTFAAPAYAETAPCQVAVCPVVQLSASETQTNAFQEIDAFGQDFDTSPHVAEVYAPDPTLPLRDDREDAERNEAPANPFDADDPSSSLVWRFAVPF